MLYLKWLKRYSIFIPKSLYFFLALLLSTKPKFHSVHGFAALWQFEQWFRLLWFPLWKLKLELIIQHTGNENFLDDRGRPISEQVMLFLIVDFVNYSQPQIIFSGWYLRWKHNSLNINLKSLQVYLINLQAMTKTGFLQCTSDFLFENN